MNKRVAWNKGMKMPSVSERMLGNLNGKGNKGRSISPEWRQKMSEAKKGKPGNAKGSKRTPEQIAKISQARRAYLKSVDPNYEYFLDSKTRPGNKRIRRERIKKLSSSHTQEEWELLKSNHAYTCLGCGRKEPEIKLTRDHIVALSNGGNDEISNIQPLCVNCNSKKATRTIRY